MFIQISVREATRRRHRMHNRFALQWLLLRIQYFPWVPSIVLLSECSCCNDNCCRRHAIDCTPKRIGRERVRFSFASKSLFQVQHTNNDDNDDDELLFVEHFDLHHVITTPAANCRVNAFHAQKENRNTRPSISRHGCTLQ